MRCFVYSFLGFLLALLVVATIVANKPDYRVEHDTSQLLSALYPVRQAIEKEMLGLKPNDDLSKLPGGPEPEDPVAEALAAVDALDKMASIERVGPNLLIVEGKLGQLVVLTATLRDGEVHWTCRGAPRDVMPDLCKVGRAR